MAFLSRITINKDNDRYLCTTFPSLECFIWHQQTQLSPVFTSPSVQSSHDEPCRCIDLFNFCISFLSQKTPSLDMCDVWGGDDDVLFTAKD